MQVSQSGETRPTILNELLSITAQEYIVNVKNTTVVILNEVLSITAQEYEISLVTLSLVAPQ